MGDASGARATTAQLPVPPPPYRPAGRGSDRRSRRLAAQVVTSVAAGLGRTDPVPELHHPALADPRVARLAAATAAYHNVLPLLWSAVEREKPGAILVAAVLEHYRPVVARALRLRVMLERAVAALTSAGVDHVIFKGPALWPYYSGPRARTGMDVDILVSRTAMAMAGAALRSAGFVGPLPPGDRRPGNAECGYQLPRTGTVVDLHWHVMREARVRQIFSWPTADLLRRARMVSADGLRMPVLDDCDAALAVATHACFDGAYRLGWLVDLALILRRVDPTELEARSRATGLTLPMAVMTDRLRLALGVQAEVRWPSSGWRTALDIVTRVRPPAGSYQRSLRAGLLYRSTGRTSRSSAGQLARLLREDVGRSLAIRDRARQPRETRDR